MIGANTLKAVQVINPPKREMRRLEADAEQRIAAALDKWRRDITRGMTADNAAFIVTRMRQRDVYEPFCDAMIAVLRDIALEGAAFGRKQIETAVLGISKGIFDIDWELANLAAEAWARQFGAQLIRGVTDTTRRRVGAMVADWTTNGESIGQLAKRIAEPGGPFGLNRARTIAVTETTRAYAEGNMAAWRESNVIKRRRWNTNVDEVVCPICGPLHNVVVGLDEAFPGGLSEPPAHVNCRCWITPVVEGAEERETGLGQFGLGPVVELPRPAVGQAIQPTVQQAKQAVSNYLNADLGEVDLSVLPEVEFDKRFAEPDEAVHGGIAAIRTPDGKIYIKDGYQSDAIHELVHAAGALEDGVGTFLNEGITQATAERIGALNNYMVRETYGKETRFVNKYVMALIEDEPEFLSGYVQAKQKTEYIVDAIWDRYGQYFSDVDDWGKAPRAAFVRNLSETLGTDMHLSYLVDDLGLGVG